MSGRKKPAAYRAHESAIVDAGARIGRGTRIWHWVHVCAGARVGTNCTLSQNVFVSGKAVIGDNVKIQNNVSVFDGVTLGDDVFCGPGMMFTNVVNPRSHVSRRGEYQATPVGRGATLGANATVVCGNAIGEYAFVGAGAVVTRDVAPYAIVVGNPARRIGWMCACGIRLPAKQGLVRCTDCAARYRITRTACRPAE
jgi:UDP-2-acetamido-3-amino-2,3-dideoxy-glucuronate N-acetyltransferase